MSMNEIITALQLLAQRQDIKDVTSKPQVVFSTEGGQSVVAVQMLSPPVGEQKVGSVKQEFKASGKNYLDAANALVAKLTEPLAARQREDSQVMNLVERVVSVTREGAKTSVNADFQLPLVR